MPRPFRQQPPTLEMTIVFEPTRAAPEILHRAYDAVLPLPRRTLPGRPQGATSGMPQAAEGSRR
jgi:hypothetical protein